MPRDETVRGDDPIPVSHPLRAVQARNVPRVVAAERAIVGRKVQIPERVEVAERVKLEPLRELEEAEIVVLAIDRGAGMDASSVVAD